MKRIRAYYRMKAIAANSGRYFDGIVHNCCRVSAANNGLAFAIHCSSPRTTTALSSKTDSSIG